MADINPFRYRGYYYDTETGFYYLQTRYYDPEIRRFINADNYELLPQLSQTLGQLNMYTYCNNNPVMMIDSTGQSPSWLKGLGVFLGCVAVVAGIAVITVLSGGTALPVIIGAAIGAGISGGISAGVQLASTGSINLGQLFVDMGVGAVMGAFGGSALGRVGMTIAGGVVGFSGSVAGDWVAGNSINWGKAAGAGALGALIAFGGGAGAQHGQLGARQAALATKQGILARNAAGGYRHPTNFNFAIQSNAGRIARATASLNQYAIHSILMSGSYNLQMGVYQYLLFN